MDCIGLASYWASCLGGTAHNLRSRSVWRRGLLADMSERFYTKLRSRCGCAKTLMSSRHEAKDPGHRSRIGSARIRSRGTSARERQEVHMRIVKLKDLHADAGWRVHSFLKLTTDEGLIGWCEYNEQFGAGGVTELIHAFAPAVIGMDPREVGRISAALHATARLAAGGINHQAVAAIENACLDVKAKALGIPVCALFGGPYRTRLPLYWSHCGSFRVWQRELFEGRLGKPPIRTLDDLKQLGHEAAARSFAALKTNPLPIGSDSRPFNPGFHITPNFLSRYPD